MTLSSYSEIQQRHTSSANRAKISLHVLFCGNDYYLQAERGFARSRLCTDEDGTTNYLVQPIGASPGWRFCTDEDGTTSNLVLYMERNYTSKKGGAICGLRIKREREEYVGILILRKPH